VLGLLLLWVALDWPAGPLGTGYLAWVHAVQFVLLAMLVPSLLLVGLGPAAHRRIARWRHTPRLWITRPTVALPLYAGVMIATHLPPVADRLMASAIGAFALDMSWLLSGLAFVWPLLLTSSDARPLSPLLRIGYVALGTIAHVFIGMWFLVADYPLFATYELAPPFGTLTPRMDQQLAGGVMLLLGTPLVVFALGLQFRALGTEDEHGP
jgi:cytochrome c oxidase assembly factor CtaG